MRKLIVQMAISVDGVVAPENNEVFDHSDEEVWTHTFGLLESVDTMLLGAGMHRDYLGHWQTQLTNPAAPASERKYAELASRVPHLVLSRSLRKVEWPNATVLAGGVGGVAALKSRAGADILLWGGPTVAAAAIEAGLVDEYHLITHPVLAGRGKKLFASVEATRSLRHQGTQTFASGIVALKYARG